MNSLALRITTSCNNYIIMSYLIIYKIILIYNVKRHVLKNNLSKQESDYTWVEEYKSPDIQ